MGADHHEYVKPKTDGTFGLSTNWSRLSKSAAGPRPAVLPQPTPNWEPITRELLEAKTLREWWYWREWRSTHPLAPLSPSYLWSAYKAKYWSGKLPSKYVPVHWFAAFAGLGFLVQYSNNAGHLYAKHH